MLFDVTHVSLPLVLNIFSTTRIYFCFFFLMMKTYVQMGISGNDVAKGTYETVVIDVSVMNITENITMVQEAQ